MKLTKTRFLVLQLAPNQSVWRITLPPGIVQAQNNELIRLVVRKVIYRNDFPVIAQGKDTFLVDDVAYTVRHGSPNALLFAQELSTIHPDITFTFDGYDGRLYISNINPSTTHIIDPYTMKFILGFHEPITLFPGSTIRAPFGIDLAPPETIHFRMDGLLSSAIEADESTVAQMDLLCVIGSDVVPFQTKVFSSQDLYSHFLTDPNLNDITIRLEDNARVPIASPNPIVMVLCIESYVDDERQILNTMKDSYEVQRLMLMGQDLNARQASQG